ncbi:hypothetical protein QBC45DRAFT_457576 [Copromyces sp. CBS 386.78]|nr:hypothetical protein QBC45DRAFT_457576 [Copromyces sp. CBS 386.78]
MPKKKAASPARSPVSKRTRTVKATSTTSKAVARKRATAPKKATAPKSRAPKATAPKASASKTSSANATVGLNSHPVERSLSPEHPLRPDRTTPGSVGSSREAGPPTPDRAAPGKNGTKPNLRRPRQSANMESPAQPKEDDKPKPPTMEVCLIRRPRRGDERKLVYTGVRGICECADCGEDFDTKTELVGCPHHPGELKVDLTEDWLDSTGLDPNVEKDRQRMDDPRYLYEDFPTGFTYTCCGNYRWGEGCELKAHRPYVYWY